MRRNEAWEALVPHYAKNRDFLAYMEELRQRWPHLTEADYEPLRERYGLSAPWLKQWVADTFDLPENQERLRVLGLDIAGEDTAYFVFEPPPRPWPEPSVESESEYVRRVNEATKQYAADTFPPEIRATEIKRDALWLYRRICEKRTWGKIDPDYPTKLPSRRHSNYAEKNPASTVMRAVKRLADDLEITLPEGRRGRPRKAKN